MSDSTLVVSIVIQTCPWIAFSRYTLVVWDAVVVRGSDMDDPLIFVLRGDLVFTGGLWLGGEPCLPIKVI